MRLHPKIPTCVFEIKYDGFRSPAQIEDVSSHLAQRQRLQNDSPTLRWLSRPAYCDFIVPMNYTSSTLTFAQRLVEDRAFGTGEQVIPAIDLSQMTGAVAQSARDLAGDYVDYRLSYVPGWQGCEISGR
jgi:hypothetical protein